MKKLYIGCVSAILTLVMIVFYFARLSFSTEPVEYSIPEFGAWYCDELQVTLVMDRDSKGIRQDSTLRVNNKIIKCTCSSEKGTPDLYLICQELECEDYRLGQTIYWWILIESNETEMVLKDRNTGKVYSFSFIE